MSALLIWSNPLPVACRVPLLWRYYGRAGSGNSASRCLAPAGVWRRNGAELGLRYGVYISYRIYIRHSSMYGERKCCGTKKLLAKTPASALTSACKVEDLAVQGLYRCGGQLYAQVACRTLARVGQLSEASASAKLSARSNQRPPPTPNYQREAIGGLR